VTPIKLLISDVDGTLVTKDKVLTSRAREAVERLRSAVLNGAVKIVGVDRVGHGNELHRHGADVVVTDLATLLEVAA
jgi:phosphoglycolate phosphatase-like HAD superfamily hydrolase